MKDLLPTEDGETGKSDDWSFERQSFLENVGVVLPIPTTLTRNILPMKGTVEVPLSLVHP
jgi:hypothetical protein